MQRKALQELIKWHSRPQRQPLIIRGARQVGKTWLVREFAKQTGLTLLECNFEKQPDLISFFETNDPHTIFRDLTHFLNQPATPNHALLFLDEVQAQPKLLAKLRWFAEEFSELTVIATGSLLDFILEEHEFSMPVGRVRYLHLEPMSFEEFLLATGENGALDTIKTADLNTPIKTAMHEKLLEAFRTYMFVGGMPAAVNAWSTDQDIQEVNQIHQSILQTYQDDFSKYAKRLPLQHLRDIIKSIPLQLGKKFKFSTANPDVQTPPLKKAVTLLTLARLCHLVLPTAANALPLAAESKKQGFKALFLDTGLLMNALGIYGITDLQLNNEGPLAEQAVGQLLRTLTPWYMEPALYYWMREKKGSSAEIDYLYPSGKNIIPIEVKAGTSGTLKSLHLLMSERQWSTAIRISQHTLSKTTVSHGIGNKTAEYTLISLPFYLIEQLPRLL